MPTIDQLASSDALEPEDTLPFYSKANSDARKVTLPVLAGYLQALNEGEPDQTVYALAVDGSTFTTTIEPAVAGGNVWALLTPSAPFTAGTITLPGIESRGDGQEVLVSCTQAVAALTVDGNGATVNGAPAALVANGFFRMRFDLVALAWFRVG